MFAFVTKWHVFIPEKTYVKKKVQRQTLLVCPRIYFWAKIADRCQLVLPWHPSRAAHCCCPGIVAAAFQFMSEARMKSCVRYESKSILLFSCCFPQDVWLILIFFRKFNTLPTACRNLKVGYCQKPVVFYTNQQACLPTPGVAVHACDLNFLNWSVYIARTCWAGYVALLEMR